MTVKVFVEPTGRKIEPFDDPMGEVLIGNRPLSDWQNDAITSAGLIRIQTFQAPCLVIPDTLFCTGEVLSRFLDKAAGQNAVLVLEESRFGRFTTPVQPFVEAVDNGWRFQKIRFESGGDEPVTDVLVSPNERPFDIPVNNPYLRTDRLELSIVGAPCMTLHHWVHILWANQIYGGIDVVNTPTWKMVLRGLWAAFRAMSFNRWKVMGRLNRIGRNCDIHPTAIVECSTLGDGVKVGPYARVLLSNLDDGVEIMAGGQVEFCTLGQSTIVTENTVVRFSVMYPEAVVSQYLMQQCVFGRRAVTTSGAYSMDLNFENEIRVPLDGKLHPTGQYFLGSAFGHGCRIGTGFWMASGRMVPNDYFVVRDGATVLSRIPKAMPTDQPLVVTGTTLAPLHPPKVDEPRD